MFYLLFGGAVAYLAIYSHFVYKNFLSEETAKQEFPIPTWTY